MAKTTTLPPVRVNEDFRKEMKLIADKENRTLGNLIETALIEYKKRNYDKKRT
jgi:hypothetical protein